MILGMFSGAQKTCMYDVQLYYKRLIDVGVSL